MNISLDFSCYHLRHLLTLVLAFHREDEIDDIQKVSSYNIWFPVVVLDNHIYNVAFLSGNLSFVTVPLSIYNWVLWVISQPD